MEGHPAGPPAGNESPPTRTTILGSFLRGRPRNSSQSHIQLTTDLTHPSTRDLSPSSPPQQQPPSPQVLSARRRTMAPYTTGGALSGFGSGSGSGQASNGNSNSNSSNIPSGLNISSMLRRRRSAGNVAQNQPPVAPPAISTSATAAAALGMGSYNTNNNNSSRSGHPAAASTSGAAAAAAAQAQAAQATSTNPSSTAVHRIRLVPHLDTRRSLRFDAIGRDLKEGDPALRIGRFTDRSGQGLAAVNATGSNKLAFRSKVVSRAHAEIWVESGGRFFVKDTKSSSGTFLNHVRLSPANTESRPFQIKDGDILQLGVDFQGGTQELFKSVKIRVEIGREWQAHANAFNTNALRNLKSLALPASTAKQAQAVTTVKLPAAGKSQIPDCCICLFSVTIRQALFIAPCSHTFHYKCIRPLLESHHPAFSCPLCRTFADLEEDVEVDVEYEEEEGGEGEGDEEGEGEGEAGLAIGIVGAGGGGVVDGKDTPEMDADGESPANSDSGHHAHAHAHAHAHPQIPGSRSNSGLGVRGETGAETEVEGEGGAGAGGGGGVMSRIRASRRGRTAVGGQTQTQTQAQAQNGTGGGGGGGASRTSPLPDLMDHDDPNPNPNPNPHPNPNADPDDLELDEEEEEDGMGMVVDVGAVLVGPGPEGEIVHGPGSAVGVGVGVGVDGEGEGTIGGKRKH